MTSEKVATEAMEDIDPMQNIELHRAESMVNDILAHQPDGGEKPRHVTGYVAARARSVGSALLRRNCEIAMFLYMFSYVLRSITSTTMILQKVCLVHLGYPDATCRHLSEHPAVKSEVEKMANNYHLGHSLLQMAPSTFLALFIGAWSDRYGRKPPVVCALVGIIADGFGTTLCALYLDSRVEFYFISALFTGFSGGFIGVLMVLYSYASDTTPSGERTMKYAFVELAFGLSMPLGSLAGGWMYKFCGFVPVFLASTCGHILTLVWVVFCVQETRGLDNSDDWPTRFKNFWTLDAVVSSFRATIKKRPNQGRKQIGLVILALSISIFSFASLTGIMFFYVHHLYDWDNTTFSTVNAVFSVTGLALMLVIVPLSKKRNVGDPVLGIVGMASLALKNIGLGLAYKTWIYYLASFLGLFSSLGSLAGRARISKVVSKDDLGKVFAFMTTAECFLPIAATSVVSQVFNLTLDFYPGLIFVVMGCLNLIPVAVFIWMARLPVLSYEEMEGKEKEASTPEK